MNFSQAHSDHLDPDRHAPPEPPEGFDGDRFTLNITRQVSGHFVIECPEWNAQIMGGKTADTLAAQVSNLLTEIVRYSDGREPVQKPPTPQETPERPLTRAEKLARRAGEVMDEIPGDDQTKRDVALGLAIEALKSLVEEAKRVRRIACAAAPE